jgi:hypothetical protein
MRIIATIIGVGIGAVVSTGAFAYGAAQPLTQGEVIRDHPVIHGVIGPATGRACAEEDSVNCFWNARRQGNGVGHSFYSVRVGQRVCVIYWDRAYNAHHGGCHHR